MLGNLLAAAGFTGVQSGPVGFHFFAGEGRGAEDLARHVEYVADFVAPGIERMATLASTPSASRAASSICGAFLLTTARSPPSSIARADTADPGR